MALKDRVTVGLSPSEVYEIDRLRYLSFSDTFHGWVIRHLEPSVDVRTQFIFAVSEHVRNVEQCIEAGETENVSSTTASRSLIERIATKYGLPEDAHKEFQSRLNTLTHEVQRLAVATETYRQYFRTQM